MLILCSNGLSSPKLLDEAKKITRNCSTAALVVTADPEYKERNYHVPRCIQDLEALGLTVDLIDIDFQPPSSLLNYDVVEFIGGNPFYLLDAIRRSKSADILRIIAKEKILIGWSAAAFVFSPTLELVNLYSPEMNFLGLTNLSALKLTDVEILPHYSRFRSKFDCFEERCCEYERSYNANVIRLNDGDGLFVTEDTVTIYQI